MSSPKFHDLVKGSAGYLKSLCSLGPSSRRRTIRVEVVQESASSRADDDLMSRGSQPNRTVDRDLDLAVLDRGEPFFKCFDPSIRQGKIVLQRSGQRVGFVQVKAQAIELVSEIRLIAPDSEHAVEQTQVTAGFYRELLH